MPICLMGQRTCFEGYYLIELTGQDVGLLAPFFFVCLGACLLLLLHGFVAKQVSLFLSLSKQPDFDAKQLVLLCESSKPTLFQNFPITFLSLAVVSQSPLNFPLYLQFLNRVSKLVI